MTQKKINLKRNDNFDRHFPNIYFYTVAEDVRIYRFAWLLQNFDMKRDMIENDGSNPLLFSSISAVIWNKYYIIVHKAIK